MDQKQRERMKRSRRLEVISILSEMGFSRRDAARAAHQADGDVDRAYGVCLTVGSLKTSSSLPLHLILCVCVSRSCWTRVHLSGPPMKSSVQTSLSR